MFLYKKAYKKKLDAERKFLLRMRYDYVERKLTIFWNLASKNRPDRQLFAGFLNSLKSTISLPIAYCLG